ncbi:MAG: ABC transporter permease [Roseiarcus sp.]|jgi:ribose transport system permease protein
MSRASFPVGGAAQSRRLLVSHLSERRETGLAAALFLVLLTVNAILNPAWLAPGAWGTVIGLAGPLVAASIASMPSILGGRGGIDVSIGPLMGFINVVVVKTLMTDLGVSSPWIVVVAALGIGASVGAVNGILTTVIRIQPIVATLGTYLVLNGATLTLLPEPAGAAPAWIKSLAGSFSIVPLAGMAATWLLIKRFTVYDWLMAIGSDDRACFTAGVPVSLIRFLSYVLGGVFAGVAALMLTGLIGSADPTVGPTFTLVAISAVALGGVSLAGGRGGFIAAVVGAAAIFLLQSALTYFNVSSFILRTVYGAILVVSVSLNALTSRAARKSLT